ncbi:MAG: glycine cleavage system aminomethyltransferase T/glycine [Candidatus Poriferisodalaceae bacterium]|jgi:glycine cleavage system aminomethyltransferase T/glycine/D-amino acid oxidase-like deaminating enzyme
MQKELPDRAEVVIIGGGIVGASVAYHLVKRGVSDVLVLEQGQLTGGTTWHAAGLVSQLKSSYSLTKLAEYSARLFDELEGETGQATGYRSPGSIAVAADEERWQELLRGVSMASTVGVEIRQMELDEVSEMWPLINRDDLVGALYIPKDGQTSPVDTTMALIKGARAGGAKVVEGVSVERVLKDGDRVVGVEMDDGRTIESDVVVMAAGMWTRQLADTVGVNVPLQACEHFYIVTEPMEGVERGMPTLRDPGNYTYFKEETGKIMAGFFEPRGKVWKLDGIPKDFCFGTLPEDWEHVGPIFEKACHRVPALAETGLQLFFNGPEAFTPDGVYYLGESPEVDGCFVAAGFNSVGIQSAGGVGWVLADWIVDGHPPSDLSAVDIRRSFPFQGKPEYLKDRISESLGLLYAMHWPFRQYESSRGQRMSSLHDRIDAAGAVFGETAGWERPNWYVNESQAREYEYSYGKQNWHENMRAECEAVRTAVGLFDQSSFAKFSVEGPDALKVLNHISANEIDVEPGVGVYTQWLNDRGGIEADLTVNRLGDEEFLVVTSGGSETRDWAWLRRACRDHDVEIANVTMDYAVIGVMGPNARKLLQPLTSADMSNEGFGFAAMQTIDIAGTKVKALRMSYVGELGWELYPTVADAPAVYDVVVAAGADHGLRHAGYHAMNSLRLESGYRHWGHDITDEDTPLEAGLGFAVAWDKPGGFVGKEALEAQRPLPRTKRLIQFRLEDSEVLSYHDDPIYRDGVVVGRTTGGMWSHTEDRCLTMAYIESEEAVTKTWLDAGSWEIEVGTKRIPVTASIRSFYDPKNERVKI